MEITIEVNKYVSFINVIYGFRGRCGGLLGPRRGIREAVCTDRMTVFRGKCKTYLRTNCLEYTETLVRAGVLR